MGSHDAIVVGAGPAGAAAALTLARGGARVALIDREAFPRDKPCGDLLGRAAVAQCRELGIDLDAIGAHAMRGVTVHTPSGGTLHGIAYRGARAMDEARTIPRLRFDAVLVERAVAAGASPWQLAVSGLWRTSSGVVGGVTARGAEQAGPAVAAPLVIAADGWGSCIARALLGARAEPAQRGIAARCYVEGVRGLHDRMRFLCERDLLPGCAWIFPIGGDRANVGLGTIVTRERAAPFRPAARLAELLEAQAPGAADMLAGARQASRIVSWPLALGWRAAPAAFDGVLLAGDAAALISPMSGSGIAAALHSGRLAGEIALDALARGDTSRRSLRGYERALRGAYRWRYAIERAGQAALYHPDRLDLVGRLARTVPHAQALAGNLLFNLG